MSNNSPLKIGNLAEPSTRWYVVPLTAAERAYWSVRNPLLGYRQPDSHDKTARVAAVIEHVELLIQHRIDQGERYFTEITNHPDLLEMRSDVVAHFKSQGIDLNIRKGGYIFVFGILKGITTNV